MPRTKKRARRGRSSGAPNRLDFRTTQPALPLSPAIKTRVGHSFDPEPFLEKNAIDIQKILYVLFGQLIQAFGTASVSRPQVLNIVSENHESALAQIQCTGETDDGMFFAISNDAKVSFKGCAVQTVRSMSTHDIAERLWVLWALDVFKDDKSRWTFLPPQFDTEIRKQNGHVSKRQGLLNRVCYQVFKPIFDTAAPEGLGSKQHVETVAQENLQNGFDAILAISDGIKDEQQKKWAQSLARESVLLLKLKDLWQAGVFDPAISSHRLLGPPVG